jgi:LysM repeat protein
MLTRMDMAPPDPARHRSESDARATAENHEAEAFRGASLGASQPRAEASVDAATPRGCPFLLAEGGGWRLDLPTRDHRCAAVSPPAPLSPEKQTRLCLTSAHTSCATFLASTAARQARIGAPPSDRATRWGLARTTTVIEDPGGLRARAMASMLDRRRWPAIPAVLLVTTLFTLALSGFRGGSTPASATASPGGSTTPVQSVRPSARPSATTAPEASATAAPPSVAPTSSPTGTPAPEESFRTYRVQSGDTLSGIAEDFDTTPRAIAELNGITVSSTLRIGQVLRIPN